MLNQLRTTNESLEEKCTELKNKLNQKEEAYQILSTDFDKIQNLFNSKTKDVCYFNFLVFLENEIIFKKN
jgi:hypothetical protein